MLIVLLLLFINTVANPTHDNNGKSQHDWTDDWFAGLAKSYIDAKTAFKITEAKNQEEAAYK